jgi:hypothetical protein
MPVAKVPEAGYDESDGISSIDGTNLSLGPSPSRRYRISNLKFTTMTDTKILSVPVVPTLAGN